MLKPCHRMPWLILAFVTHSIHQMPSQPHKDNNKSTDQGTPTPKHGQNLGYLRAEIPYVGAQRSVCFAVWGPPVCLRRRLGSSCVLTCPCVITSICWLNNLLVHSSVFTAIVWHNSQLALSSVRLFFFALTSVNHVVSWLSRLFTHPKYT